MRADSHYVDLLTSRSPATRERRIAVAMLDAPQIADVPALVPLIESVRQHGVLQPLLVQEREGALRVISGQRRLAAAIAAGLREVPCLVHDVDNRTAERMRLACDGTEAPAPTVPTAADQSGEVLARSLATASSLADLLTGDISDLSRGVVGGLLRAELFRANSVLQGARIVRGELAVLRGAVAVTPLIDRVLQGFAAERRMRKVEFIPQIDLPHGHIVVADERLLGAALTGAAIATLALLESLPATRVAVVAGLTARRQLTLAVSQDHVVPSPVWAQRAFDLEWRDRPGGAAAVLAMASVQQAARAHGGDAAAMLSPRGSRIALTIPAGA
jgi:hypothetical protein